MSFTCRDLDAALREGVPEALSSARAHAEGCDDCRERLFAWDAISEMAPSLRRSWESPQLWPAIRRSLAGEARPRRAAFLAMAASVLLAVGAAAYLGLRQWQPRIDSADLPQHLLTERALAQVERSEDDYVASIDRLAKLAEPRLLGPSSPLLANYREKLQVLDAAIADCRAQIERNRFNAHLRRELLSVYQEKQRTLQKLMEERS